MRLLKFEEELHSLLLTPSPNSLSANRNSLGKDFPKLLAREDNQVNAFELQEIAAEALRKAWRWNTEVPKAKMLRVMSRLWRKSDYMSHFQIHWKLVGSS